MTVSPPTGPPIAVPMDRIRVQALIYLIQQLDPGYLLPSATEDSAAAREDIWLAMLAPVDAAWAKRTIEAYYAKGQRRLKPGDLRSSWDQEVARWQSRQEQTERALRRDAGEVGGLASVGELLGADGAPPVGGPLTDGECWRAIARHDRTLAKEHPGTRYPHRSPENLAEAVEAYRAGDEIPPPVGGLGLDYWTKEQHEHDEAMFERDFVSTVDSWDRSCGTRMCPCPHVNCTKGWMDADEVVVRKGFPYHSQRRCTTCEQALLELGGRDG